MVSVQRLLPTSLFFQPSGELRSQAQQKKCTHSLYRMTKRWRNTRCTGLCMARDTSCQGQSKAIASCIQARALRICPPQYKYQEEGRWGVGVGGRGAGGSGILEVYRRSSYPLEEWFNFEKRD